jgi:predicted aldo/keto reductase-like oxidoreductase
VAEFNIKGRVSQVQKRILGKTNYEVSVVGFGGIPIQRVGKKEAMALISAASDQGINFIDTATGYSDSEALIGYGIEHDGRDKWIVATKCPLRDYEGMKNAINSSLKKLRVEVIDLYQLHNVSSEADFQQVMGDKGALKALKEAKAEGKIKEIGITSHSVEMLEKAIETGEFSTIQFPYNLVERQGEKLFQRAKELNLGVIIMKPIAGGAISNPTLSLKFIMENDNISVMIPGMDKIEHIIENCKVAKFPSKLTHDEKEAIKVEAEALGNVFCRRCGYCGPCPVGINIPGQMVLEGYFLRYDLKDWAKKRYAEQVIKASDCIGCGQCEPKCPYNLDIRGSMKRIHQNLG